MNVPGALPKTTNGNQIVVVIEDRYSKLTGAIQMSKTKPMYTENIFHYNQFNAYGILFFLLTDNGMQFAYKLFAPLCELLGVKHPKIAAYHMQTHGQVEQFNKKLVARLSGHVAELQKDLERSIVPFTYAYNSQVH